MNHRRTDADRALVFSTALGWMAVAWRGSQVVAIRFGHRSARSAKAALGPDVLASTPCVVLGKGQPPAAQLSDAQQALVERLTAYAQGEPDTFVDVPIVVDHLSEFQRRVVTICRHIGYGKTLTYAQLAARAGSPRAARAVGNVMRTNNYPLLVPCHRVVGAGGLGGYSAPDGLAMKQRLLRMEAGEAMAGMG